MQKCTNPSKSPEIYYAQSNKPKVKKYAASPTTNLALRNRPDPAHSQVHTNMDDSTDPEDFCVVITAVAEDNGEDDAAKVASRPGEAR